jgi:hypothetical protein
MKIGKREFNNGLGLIGKDPRTIEAWLDSIEFDLEEETYDVFGAFESFEVLEDQINSGDLEELLYQEDEIDEKRYNALVSGDSPTSNEIAEFQRLTVERLRAEYLEEKIIFFGEITCQKEQILVLTRKFGNSFDGVSANLMCMCIPDEAELQEVFKHGVLIKD